MRIETNVTKLLGIDLPIIQAGMSWASSNSALPLAVSNAGGLGVLAAGPMYPHDLEEAINEIRAGTDRPFAVNLPLYRQGADAIIDMLLAKRIPVLIASQGGPKKYIDRFKAAGTICLHVVSGEVHARKAADAGVDGLIAVGGEAGGHPPPELVSTLVLGRAIAKAVPDVPLILSGGFADGSGLAAALSLGAGAAQFGSRFMLSREARLHPAYQDMLVKAGVADTMVVGRGFGAIRVVRNQFAEGMAKAEAAGLSDDQRKALFVASSLKAAAFDGDVSGGKVEAGQSTGLVSEVLPAAEIVTRIAKEYVQVVSSLPNAVYDGNSKEISNVG
ncbi:MULTISPECIES: nitronate monooxygenase family protein [unclassified Ensifer]|uniref:NAD(P)H-dependent flavin oxidoreductase n=1 Tax=unclassified Ensifer TaxID=2633371 RepID=UPI000710967D|nr:MULTISPECIES: nitronate monooxygenase family protein [unclassified Ensifer]KRD72117.1 2-nitropropane dioxygenase [Ensifer sp. Root278]MBV7522445.1 nitronate monooxygenase family protein [Ensifer sp. ENS12]